MSSSSATTLSNNHHIMNSSNNGSLINVLMPLADMNSHNLHRAQLISNLNATNNQYTTLTFPNNYQASNTSSTLPSTMPINGQQIANFNNKHATIYTQNDQLLNDNFYCQTSFNNGSAIIDSNSLTNQSNHYQLLNKQPNYHLTSLPSSNYSSQPHNYILQTSLPPSTNQTASFSPNFTTSNQPPSINYLSRDELKFNLNNVNSNAQFDLICGDRLSPVYTKLSPNSNSLIKECLITNSENAMLQRNAASKFIELTSSQNSTASVYSDTLKSKLATSPKNNLKLLNAASTGLDLLNCDKTYCDLIKSDKNRQM